MADTINVSVANQAFPPPPGGSQAGPVPSYVQVPDLPMVPSSFSRGTTNPFQAEVNVNAQNVTRPSPVDFVVTESGNFATNVVNADRQNFVVSSTTVLNAGTQQESYQVFTTTAGLAAFGLSLVGKTAAFPAAASASAPENIPTRVITLFGDNWIIVNRYDPFGNSLAAPVATNPLTVIIYRDGTEAVNDTNVAEVDVVVRPAPPVATTAPSVGGRSLGNILATDGVVRPFVGSGQAAPPFLGTFEVENQVPLGLGLPINVFQ